MRFLLAIVLVAIGISVPGNLVAQQALPGAEEPANPAGHPQRLLFPIRHLDPAAVAEKVNVIFNQGANPPVAIVAVPGTGSVLVSASPDTMQEIVKILEQLDQPARAILVDVWIVDLHPDASKVDVAKPRGPAELFTSGPRIKVQEALAKAEKDGAVAVVNHIQFAAVDGREASAQQGERKPKVTATNVTNAGRISTLTMDNIGATVKVTPKISDSNQIMLDITAEKSFYAPEFTGAIMSQPVNGPEVRSPSCISLLCKSTANLTSGEVATLTGLKSAADDTAGSYQVLVSAEILPSNAK